MGDEDDGDVVERLAALGLERRHVEPQSRQCKEAVRQRIWRSMEAKGSLKRFRHHHPDHERRIPYFRNCETAAKRLARLDFFRKAKVVKVNPSLAQMELRRLILEDRQKTLLVPKPALADENFLIALKGAELSRNQRRRAQTKMGAADLGQTLDVGGLAKKDHFARIDVYVVASVAVATNGVRLGKGMGFAELEWAILWTLGLVDDRTCVVTTVHEEQIMPDEDLSPERFMEDHDLPVDVIVTPNRSVFVQPQLQKPRKGVIWELLTPSQMDNLPVLRRLKQM